MIVGPTTTNFLYLSRGMKTALETLNLLLLRLQLFHIAHRTQHIIIWICMV
ncbi:hypothetical protein Lalb_Chr01g0015621 [Lupinus albus]|uniref:Uncharacterized protein n=1 Tax=Lupinus albus TaxID=3870 RepID=A0A6A4R8N3_LUPAL|nr:hypothetical protein Lalb_Chr01g0015621 [Lupinus albus]